MGKRVALVCIGNSNYGNNLTNFCLYKVLTDMGYATTVINAPKELYDEFDGCELFSMFERTICNAVTNPCKCAELSELSNQFDVYVTGSDQIWRWGFCYLSDWYTYLDWVSGDKLKLSYATSFGTNHFENQAPEILEIARMLLERFSAISVREKSGIGIINNEFGLKRNDIVQVIDPVLLCPKKYIEELFDCFDGSAKKADLAIYLWENDAHNRRIVNRIKEYYEYESEEMIQVVTISQINLKRKYTDNHNIPSVEKWLELIGNCELLVTDSYHGVCTALALEKQFIFIMKDNQRGNCRVTELLDILDLSNRIVSIESDISQLSTIEYVTVTKRLNEIKGDAMIWLKNSIEASHLKENPKYLDKWIDKRKCTERIVNYCNLYIRERFELDASIDTPVIAWGFGKDFYDVSVILYKILGIRYVVDNDSKKWGGNLGCIKCIGPNEIPNKECVVLLCLHSEKSINDVTKQLNEMNISRIVLYSDLENLMKRNQDTGSN